MKIQSKMSEDEEDYMSDAFLAKCIPEDVRPGLKRSHATQREHEMLKKKSDQKEENKTKKNKVNLEVEKRHEGLQKSIDSSNKGFAMLAKMGYKAGESLGKSNSGRIEPIPIEVKNDRGGLGREAAKKQIQEAKAKLKANRQKIVTVTTEDFRASQSLKLKSRRIESDLFRAQKACRQLDMSKEITEPVEIWFWPKTIAEAPEEVQDDNDEIRIQEIHEEDNDDVDDEEEEIEFPPDQMLLVITQYLRTEHLFCIWCGITFNDTEDLENSCPGNSREDHDD